MTKGSCVYRAAATVCEYQFGITIDPRVFDSYNVGTGIPVEKIVVVLNEALWSYGICVDAVYCAGALLVELQGYYGNEIVRAVESDYTILPPVIVLVTPNHAGGILPGMIASDTVMAITLKRRE